MARKMRVLENTGQFDRKDELAEEAVCCEPVSPANSLLTGKRTGNFFVSARFNEFDRKFTVSNQSFTAVFPMNRSREFDGCLQGIWTAPTGWTGIGSRFCCLLGAQSRPICCVGSLGSMQSGPRSTHVPRRPPACSRRLTSDEAPAHHLRVQGVRQSENTEL